MSGLVPLVVTEKPGHGKKLDWVPKSEKGRRALFPNALVDCGADGGVLKLITLRELTMLRFMNAVTDKAEWTKKVYDESIIQKWREDSSEEAIKEDAPAEVHMTEKMFAYCIKELQHRAENYAKLPGGAIQVYPGDVWKSDFAVPEATRRSLIERVRPLEQVPDNKKDWHPGSDGKVLDLVHPSLFPLIYGTSKILPVGAAATTLDDSIGRCGEGEVTVVPPLPPPPPPGPHWQPQTPEHFPYSNKFQWLPCEVDISGEKPKIATYINNLHPKHHRELYTVIEDIIEAAIPLWELTLSPHHNSPNSVRRVVYREARYDPDPENTEPYPEQGEDEDDEDYDARVEAFEAWCEDTRRVILPEPGEFEPLPEPPRLCLKTEWGLKRPLQVIVKLVNIELTPDKPEYEGGAWHVEGMMNEAICASAIYYYSSENLTPSSLSFRQQSPDVGYEHVNHPQNHYEWLPQVFGLSNEEDTIQYLGSVDTREGRLITFPNILQHQVQPFKLADPTKPGHRKILALFLVDPHTSVISTADIPPQRLDWWSEELISKEQGRDADALTNLPNELKVQIFSGVEGFPIGMDEAKEQRELLMEERKSFVVSHQAQFAGGIISLCEH
ncbi:hypothetical protein D9611_008229 [Ephemerocybe angulata]|uniref:Uncharacterized protein n=1 Tax=Ephemerocybe angulata TaxID=980116 RepID=A0A8H5BIU5_9AGAR|nr:hypothetical protein D9611_008229 [Tulosesus angulatus]